MTESIYERQLERIDYYSPSRLQPDPHASSSHDYPLQQEQHADYQAQQPHFPTRQFAPIYHSSPSIGAEQCTPGYGERKQLYLQERLENVVDDLTNFWKKTKVRSLPSFFLRQLRKLMSMVDRRCRHHLTKSRMSSINSSKRKIQDSTTISKRTTRQERSTASKFFLTTHLLHTHLSVVKNRNSTLLLFNSTLNRCWRTESTLSRKSLLPPLVLSSRRTLSLVHSLFDFPHSPSTTRTMHPHVRARLISTLLSSEALTSSKRRFIPIRRSILSLNFAER